MLLALNQLLLLARPPAFRTPKRCGRRKAGIFDFPAFKKFLNCQYLQPREPQAREVRRLVKPSRSCFFHHNICVLIQSIYELDLEPVFWGFGAKEAVAPKQLSIAGF